MTTTPDLSFMYKDVKKVPSFTLNLGKGPLEFDYQEGVVLAVREDRWKTSFIMEKGNGREENFELVNQIPLRPGHFVAVVSARNKKQNTEHLVGLVNHSTEMNHTFGNISYLPKADKLLKIGILLSIIFVTLYARNNIFAGLDLPVLSWILSIIGGIFGGMIPFVLLDNKILRPLTTRKVKKKLDPYLSAIYQTRAD